MAEARDIDPVDRLRLDEHMYLVVSLHHRLNWVKDRVKFPAGYQTAEIWFWESAFQASKRVSTRKSAMGGKRPLYPPRANVIYINAV